MQFRTIVETAPSRRAISYATPGLSLGSCFAENIAARMQRAKFPLVSNPFGVLYNPASIASAIELLAAGAEFDDSGLVRDGDLWSSFRFHGSFSSADPSEALARMNGSVAAGAEALRRAEYVLITFGTAWVYELSEEFHRDFPPTDAAGGSPFPEGGVVANCHKFPSRYFHRRRMEVGEIEELYSRLIEGGALVGKQVVLTVSPVRHMKDGAAANGVSKATLILAASHLAARYDNVEYFPGYEIVNDELRDYRFYAADMAHPSPVAVDYIWERFSSSFFREDTLRTMASVEKIAAAAEHRPLNPASPSHAEFRRSMLRRIEELAALHPGIDLSAEAAFFAD